jgi:competence protein ComEA
MRAFRLLILILALHVAGGMAQAPAASTRAKNAERSSLLDINTATPGQLRALPGMGDAYVRRVIAGRPYSAKNQLVTRGVIPESAYERIAAGIVAKRAAK